MNIDIVLTELVNSLDENSQEEKSEDLGDLRDEEKSFRVISNDFDKDEWRW